VASSAYSRQRSGRPDAWEYADQQGFVFQREFDDDGDGTVDRIEYADHPESPPAEPGAP